MNPPRDPREAWLAEFRNRYGLRRLPRAAMDHALTHRSYAAEHPDALDNERLEFLGDAVVGEIASEMLYAAHPDKREGELSKLRSRLVSRAELGRRAEEMGIGRLLLLGRGERKTGGGRLRSTLGSALEALIGAIYLHRGHAGARRFVREHVLAPLREGVEREGGPHGDYKSALQEWTQRTHGVVPVYHKIGDRGPAHAKEFCVEVELLGRRLAQGQGRRIKEAENAAARRALDILTGETPP